MYLSTSTSPLLLASGAEILHDVALMVGGENVADMRFLEEMITVRQQNMYVHKVQLRSLISTCWKMSLLNSSSSKASWMSRRYTSGSLSLSDSADSADFADSVVPSSPTAMTAR